MNGTVSGQQLRAFIERIERLEDEKRTIADDIKEVKSEAKGSGFDLPTINAILKLRKKDAAERDEEAAMLDLYMSAIGMLPLFEPAQNSNTPDQREVMDPAAVETTTEKQAACSDRPTNSQDTPHHPANAGEDDPIQASPAPNPVSLHISSPVASTTHASQGNSEHGADIAAGSLGSSSHDRLEVVSA